MYPHLHLANTRADDDGRRSRSADVPDMVTVVATIPACTGRSAPTRAECYNNSYYPFEERDDVTTAAPAAAAKCQSPTNSREPCPPPPSSPQAFASEPLYGSRASPENFPPAKDAADAAAAAAAAAAVNSDESAWGVRLRNMVILVDALTALWALICLALFIVTVLSYVLLKKQYMQHHHAHSHSDTVSDDGASASMESTSTAAASGNDYDSTYYSFYRIDDDAYFDDGTVDWTNNATNAINETAASMQQQQQQQQQHHSNHNLEAAVTSILCGLALQIVASLVGIVGALHYSLSLTASSAIGYAVAWVWNLLSCDVLGVIATTFCLVPHILFIHYLHQTRSKRSVRHRPITDAFTCGMWKRRDAATGINDDVYV